MFLLVNSGAVRVLFGEFLVLGRFGIHHFGLLGEIPGQPMMVFRSTRCNQMFRFALLIVGFNPAANARLPASAINNNDPPWHVIL